MYVKTVLEAKQMTVMDCCLDEYFRILHLLKGVHSCDTPHHKCTPNKCNFYENMVKVRGFDNLQRSVTTDAVFEKYGVDTHLLTVNLADANYLLLSVPPGSPVETLVSVEPPASPLVLPANSC